MIDDEVRLRLRADRENVFYWKCVLWRMCVSSISHVFIFHLTQVIVNFFFFACHTELMCFLFLFPHYTFFMAESFFTMFCRKCTFSAVMYAPLIILSFCCIFSDPGRRTVFEAVSVAEPHHYRVDFPASGPVAHGSQLRTPYPRIHCQKHRWRTAATAG